MSEVVFKEFWGKRSWSQEDIAHEVGVSLSTIQRWERHDVSKSFRLARRELIRLLQESNIDVDEIKSC